MFATVILWFVYAVFLKLAIGLATDVDGRTNSLGRAFITAAVLSIGQGLLAKVGGIVLLLWPIAWLFIIKRSYDIGWGRSILVWLALVVIAIAVVFLLLVPLGLVAVAGGIIGLSL
jgi:hypothetical protein